MVLRDELSKDLLDLRGSDFQDTFMKQNMCINIYVYIYIYLYRERDV